MSEALKRWQTHVWVSQGTKNSVTIYGESLEQLRLEVKRWLKENKPQLFSNTPPNYEVIRRIKQYFYSDGQLSVTVDSYGKREPLTVGWYYSEGMTFFERPTPLPDFETVVNHFVEQALITEAGPDYKQEEVGENKWLASLVPTFYGAVVGVISSICYLFFPSEGAGTNYLLLQENLFFSLIMIISMTCGFAFLGWAITSRRSD